MPGDEGFFLQSAPVGKQKATKIVRSDVTYIRI